MYVVKNLDLEILCFLYGGPDFFNKSVVIDRLENVKVVWKIWFKINFNRSYVSAQTYT